MQLQLQLQLQHWRPHLKWGGLSMQVQQGYKQGQSIPASRKYLRDRIVSVSLHISHDLHKIGNIGRPNAYCIIPELVFRFNRQGRIPAESNIIKTKG